MSKENLEKQIELLVKDDESNQQTIINQRQEIERLEERIEDLNIINEEHRILNGMIRKELQQKENIIKEVREYIETIVKNTPSSTRKDYANMLLIDYKKVIEILDKEIQDV